MLWLTMQRCCSLRPSQPDGTTTDQQHASGFASLDRLPIDGGWRATDWLATNRAVHEARGGGEGSFGAKRGGSRTTPGGVVCQPTAPADKKARLLICGFGFGGRSSF